MRIKSDDLDVEFTPNKIKRRKKNVTISGATFYGKDAIFHGTLKEENADVTDLKSYKEWTLDYSFDSDSIDGEIKGYPELSQFLGLTLQEVRTLYKRHALPEPKNGWDGDDKMRIWDKKVMAKARKFIRMNRYELLQEVLKKL